MMSLRRLLGFGLALVGGTAAGAAPAAGQIGALAVAAAAAGSGGEYALAGAPVFSESGLVLAEGWAAGAFGVTTSTGVTFHDGFGGSVAGDLGQTTLSSGAFAAVGGRAMVGAVLHPYVAVEASARGLTESYSGLGSLTLVGKVALTPAQPTQVAAGLSVALPTGDDEVAPQATAVAAGLGVSRPLDSRTSLHGGLSLTFVGDDGGTSVGFNGAVVRQLSPSAWLSGEALGSAFDGEWQLLLAPGFRLRANDRVFIDAGVAFGALSSDGAAPIDYGVALGVTLVPRR